jgi:hypothetical protein
MAPLATAYALTTPLLLCYALTHTLGGLLLTPPPPTPSSNIVWQGMQTVSFPFMGRSDCTYGEFYMGFGLMVTVFLVFSAGVSAVLWGVERRWALKGRGRPGEGKEKSATKEKGKGKTVKREDVEGASAEEIRVLIRPLAWMMFVSQVVTVVLSWVYFFLPPVVMGLLISGLAGWECFTTYAY